VDPADLDLIIRAAAEAACQAMKSIDPDLDGDMDVPGVSMDTDPDMDAESEPDPEDPAAESAPTQETSPPETAREEEAPAMAEPTTLAEAESPASGDDPSTSTNPLNDNQPDSPQDNDGDNSFESFIARMISMIAAQAAADGKMNPAYTKLVSDLIMSAGIGRGGPNPAASVALQGAGTVPAPSLGSMRGETEAVNAVVTETQDDLIARKVEEALVKERQKLTEMGAGPVRKGLVRPVGETTYSEEGSALPEGWPAKPLDKYTEAERKQYVEPYVVGAVLGNRA